MKAMIKHFIKNDKLKKKILINLSLIKILLYLLAKKTSCIL